MGGWEEERSSNAHAYAKGCLFVCLSAWGVGLESGEWDGMGEEILLHLASHLCITRESIRVHVCLCIHTYAVVLLILNRFSFLVFDSFLTFPLSFHAFMHACMQAGMQACRHSIKSNQIPLRSKSQTNGRTFIVDRVFVFMHVHTALFLYISFGRSVGWYLRCYMHAFIRADICFCRRSFVPAFGDINPFFFSSFLLFLFLYPQT